MQPAPVLRADALAQGERHVHEQHQLGREHADRSGDWAVGDQPRHGEPEQRDLDGRVEDERDAVERDHAEAEEGQEAVEVGHGRLAQPPERARFHDETHQHRGGQEDVCGQSARARDEPERRVLHASAPVITVRPSPVTRTAATPSRAASTIACSSPARKSDFASTSASAAELPTTVTRTRSLFEGRPVAGSMRWCCSSPFRRQRLRSRPDVASAPETSSSVTNPFAVSTPIGQRLPRTATSPPALTRHGPSLESRSAARSTA